MDAIGENQRLRQPPPRFAAKEVPRGVFISIDGTPASPRSTFAWGAARGRRGGGSDAANAIGLAWIVAEGKLVEAGLQVLRLDRVRICANEPASASPARLSS